MKQKIIPLIVSLFVVIIAITAVVVQPKKNISSAPKASQQEIMPSNQTSKEGIKKESAGVKGSNSNSNVSASKKAYTATQVAAHATPASCWTIINNNVYDLSQWIGAHPGGENAILRICGKDGSDAFNTQHGGQQRPERILESYLIGIVKQ